MEKKFQPFQKICQTFSVTAPTENDVYALICSHIPNTKQDLRTLAQDLLAIHSGDLRKILQSLREIKKDMTEGKLNVSQIRETIEVGLADAHALGSNRIRRSETIKSAVGQLLRGSLDMTAEVPLNNNDLNLAGLHLHESLPTWIKKYIGNTVDGYEMYKSTFGTILASDRLDYYTFFFQHWTLFPLTYQAKLQSVNQKLFSTGVSEENASSWKDDNMEYTAVLSKQSMLYNQFRYLCEMRDLFFTSNLHHDGGFDSTFWKANLYLVVANNELEKPMTPGHKKHSTCPIWENTDFWRAFLPKHFPTGEANRFMRLIKALEIPKPVPFR
jgi:hypothetical protein